MYMAPPFLAYYAAWTNDIATLQQVVQQLAEDRHAPNQIILVDDGSPIAVPLDFGEGKVRHLFTLHPVCTISV